MMTHLDLLFIKIIKSALLDEQYDLPSAITTADIEKLLRMAENHSS